MKLENPATQLPDEKSLPKPRPEKSGAKKIVFLAFFAVLVVGGTAFWLTRDDSTREEWQNKATEAVDNAVKDTPLAGAADLLRSTPPPPPVFGASPSPGAPGTLSGRNIQGTVSSPVDTQSAQNPSTTAPNPSARPGATPSSVAADNTVRPDFVEDLAAYLVSHYKPGQRDGGLAVSMQAINQRYGVRMTGLAGDQQGGRAGLLRYVFNPSMIQGLYVMYVDRFMQALERQAAAKSFKPAQIQQLSMAVAGRSVVLAGALEGIAAMSDLDKRLKELQQASQTVVDVNSQMTQVVFELDQLREEKAAQSRIDAIQTRLDGISSRYRKALESRSSLQRSLVASIRQGGGQSLDDDTVLFLAHWVDRRLRQMPQAIASVQTSAGILRDLARRCAQQGTAPVTVGGQN